MVLTLTLMCTTRVLIWAVKSLLDRKVLVKVCCEGSDIIRSVFSPSLSLALPDVIKLQLVEAGLVECLLEVVAQTVDSDREEDVAQLKTASDLMVLLLLGGTGPKLWHHKI